MPFIPFGETQEIVGGFQVEAAVRSKPCSSCSSLKLRCFEPALSGCFLKIPELELFHHHALHTTHTCKTPQYSFNPAPFVSCFNFSTAFPHDVSDTSLEFLHNLRRGIAARQSLDFCPRCEALSEQRGAGPEGGSGNRNHNSFMRQCMAGKIR